MSTEDHANIQTSLYDDNELLPLLITFPEITDCKINTEQFLNASRAALKMIDRFGKVFTAIKYDMHTNIEKLTSKFKSNEEKYSTLQDMILVEKKSHNKNKFVIESILWLARELRMIQLIFSRIVEAHEMGDPPEELFPTIKDAYRESLEPYHGFMATQLFNFFLFLIVIITKCSSTFRVTFTSCKWYWR
ncbi:uncharacterized protein LOC122852538 isoform X2 [Aphidius gifuensis]|uniref:uncharacterized protein LOC122852538 isoform X2 n=1 Tax=Aphidius gifuensis TaxID=684658 RepID=UPI001CDCD6D0|nr:uncharacterized protein LOC122852538 isoform X2 [Aphidius gifuensis]